MLNNEITYRTHRYRGLGMVGGFLAFALACSVGAIANINVAVVLYKSNQTGGLPGLSGAAAERRVELRGQHHPHLAPAPARLTRPVDTGARCPR